MWDHWNPKPGTFERCQKARVLEVEGKSVKEIAASLQVSTTTVRHYLYQLAWHERMLREGHKSRWTDGLPRKVRNKLFGWDIKSREDCAPLLAEVLAMKGRRVVLPAAREVVEFFGKRVEITREHSLSLDDVNAIRKWLGVHPYIKPSRVPTKAEITRSINILTRLGWGLTPPGKWPEKP